MKINKNLVKLFDVPDTAIIAEPKAASGGTFDNNNFQKDYELVQGNLKDLLGNGTIALESALKVATESDSPRAFEVVAILLKTMADLNNNVLDVHKKAKDTTSSNTKVSQTNNSVFVGSTKDLQNLLNKDRSTNKIIDAEIHYDRYNVELSYKTHKEIPGPAVGCIYDLGSHIIDQALQLFGMPQSLFAEIAINVKYSI